MNEQKRHLILTYAYGEDYRFRELPSKNGKYIMDSDLAWEVVQELQRKGDWRKFKELAWLSSEGDMTLWLYNPDNFFKCFGEFLEQREGK